MAKKEVKLKEEKFIHLISGKDTSCGAHLSRAFLCVAEQLYKPATSIRNKLFDAGIKSSHDLGRPTASVGNMTTGGTGKTPVVKWLSSKLLERNHHPAILLRGYRANDGLSDEAELLKQPGVEVEANPNRVAGANAVLSRNANVDVFILDDGFQHRRAKRHFDLVLIDASNPFGFDHVLPRGLLREPLAGLSRASAILITHVDRARDLDELLQQIRKYNSACPIFQCRHKIKRLISPHDQPISLSTVGECIAVAGIGNPEGFRTNLAHLGLTITKLLTYPDHYPYSADDLKQIEITAAGKMIVTTEKDWTKLKHLSGINNTRIARAVLEIDFIDDHAVQLLELINNTLQKKT